MAQQRIFRTRWRHFPIFALCFTKAGPIGYDSFHDKCDLIARVKNTVNGNVISQYDYAHDALGRRTSAAKSGTMMAASENPAYGYNARSELVSPSSTYRE